MSDPIALFNRLIAEVGADNMAAAAQYFDPDFTLHQDPGMPFGGEWKGVEGFFKGYRMVHKVFGPNCLTMLFQCADPKGDHASMHLKLHGRPAGASEPVEGNITVVWTFRNDLALEARAFYYNTPRLSAPLLNP